MPVVIDGVSVIIQNTVLERRFPGGIGAYEQACPNAPYCSDGRICRVAFALEADARAFVEGLARYGFVSPWSGEPSEVAVAVLHVNLLFPCGWLEIDLATIAAADGHRYGAAVARLRGDGTSEVVTHAGWKPTGLHTLWDLG